MSLAAKGVRHLVLGVLLAFALMPLYWMLIASVKPQADQLAQGNPWVPSPPTLENYSRLLASPLFGHWALNTVVVAAGTIGVSLAASALAAYALAYLRIPHSRGIVLCFFATYLVPQGVLFIPVVRMLAQLHLLNTPFALILTYPSLVIPFGIWVLWSFFQGLPPALVEHARLEGAGSGAILRHVLLPLAAPALAAVTVFALAVVFNDFLYAFSFIAADQDQTLMGGLGVTNADVGDPGALFAGIMLGTAPVAILCAFFADAYARGIGTGFIEG